MHKTWSKSLLVVFLITLSIATPAFAQRSSRTASNLRDGREVKAAFQSLVTAADACTVRVLSSGKEAALGTVVGSDGWVVTKYSELREPVTCRLSDGRQLKAKVVGYDPQYDLAMLKIEATGLKSVDWTDTDKGPEVGQLLATAAPGDLPLAVGVVSVPRRMIPPRSRLGVSFDRSQDKPLIDGVLSGSPAEQAGLKAGDVVLQLEGKPVDNSDQMVDMIHQYKPGDRVQLLVRREGKDLKITATLKRPEEVGNVTRSDRMNEMGGTLSYRSSSFPLVIQHDTVLRPADCGGPLVDLSGKVVGINIARGGRTESYAAPADAVQKLLVDLESGRMAPHEALPGSKETNTSLPKTDDKKPDDKSASS